MEVIEMIGKNVKPFALNLMHQKNAWMQELMEVIEMTGKNVMQFALNWKHQKNA